MNALGFLLTAVFCLGVIALPRHWAAAAILAAVCYVTQAQEISLGFHFTSIRLALLAGAARAVAKGELRRLRLNGIDRMVIAYALSLLVMSTIRMGTMEQFIYQLGGTYNIVLSYFVFRTLIQGKEDIVKVMGLLAFSSIPMAILLLRESSSGNNIFSAFGGVPSTSLFRDEHFRSQGAFRSPITAGSYGATLAMIFVGCLFAGIRRRSSVVGLVTSLLIVVCARSSGPFLGLALGFVSLACWRLRTRTQEIRWGIAVTLVSLHLVMKAPVWFLIGRISDVVGGGGYHRAYLIDRFVANAGDWLAVGTSDTSSWMATQLEFGGADLTNQFVSDGVNAGVIGLLVSIALFVRCFHCLGAALARARLTDTRSEKLLWSMGSTLVGSIGILFSVTYFDQMHVVWYFLLACTAALSFERVSLAETADAQIANDTGPGEHTRATATDLKCHPATVS